MRGAAQLGYWAKFGRDMDGAREEISMETRHYGSTGSLTEHPLTDKRQTSHNRALFSSKPKPEEIDMTTPLTRGNSGSVADPEMNAAAILDADDPDYGTVSPSSHAETDTCLHTANAAINPAAISLSASTIHTDPGEAGCRISDLDGSSDKLKEDETCGWGLFRPHWCQKFRNPKVVLFFLCCAGAIQVS